MTDFKLDSFGDLDFGVDNKDGLQLHTDFGEEAAQRLGQALSLNLAEWFANVNAGLPFILNKEEGVGVGLRYFLGDKSPNLAQFIASSLDIYIESLSFVKNLNSSSNTLDRKTRVFTYDFEVELITGEVISFPHSTVLNI